MMATELDRFRGLYNVRENKDSSYYKSFNYSTFAFKKRYDILNLKIGLSRMNRSF